MSDIVDGGKSTPLAHTFQSHEIVAIPFEGELYIILAQLERAWGYAQFGLSKQLARFEAKGQVRAGAHYRKLTNGTLAAFKTAAGMLFAKCEVDPKASQLLVVTERGLYRLLTLIPDTAIAIAFQDWLESEVLPAINRTGSYTAGRVLPGAEAPQLDGQAVAPPTPPAPRSGRGRRASSYGPARDLLELLDRYRRGRVIDASAWHALRALAEQLDALPFTAGVLPEAPARRLLTSSPSGPLDAQLDQVMGTPPEDRINRVYYDTSRDALYEAAHARAAAARGERSSLLNSRRWSGLNVWIGWLHQHRVSVEVFHEALVRLEQLAEDLFGPMPSAARASGPQ